MGMKKKKKNKKKKIKIDDEKHMDCSEIVPCRWSWRRRLLLWLFGTKAVEEMEDNVSVTKFRLARPFCSWKNYWYCNQNRRARYAYVIPLAKHFDYWKYVVRAKDEIACQYMYLRQLSWL